jgi:hypothetical protein
MLVLMQSIIDTAHGHTQGVVNVLKEVKNKFQIDKAL